MFQLKLRYIYAFASWLLVTQAWPAPCNEDAHCPVGFHCAPQQKICQQCLLCEDLKRESPLASNFCITSVAECGSCLTGLIESKLGSTEACVLSDAKGPPRRHHYGWVAILTGVLLFAILAMLAGLALRNFETFRVLALTTVRSPAATGTDSTASATAPPPPYNTVALAHQKHSNILGEESTWPFIEPVTSTTARPEPARETSDFQAARVFNTPSYIRGSPLSSVYDSSTVDELDEPIFETRDVEMAERTSTNEVAAVQHTRPRMGRQDSSSSHSEEGESTPPHFSAHNCSPCIVNVIQNVTNVQQQQLNHLS